MFCYQCEQSAKGTGCVKSGVCGKDPESAALQDLIDFTVKNLAKHAYHLRKMGAPDRDADVFLIEELFTTVTNVNFDPDRLEQVLRKAQVVGKRMRENYEKECAKAGLVTQKLCKEENKLADTREGLLEQAKSLGIESRKKEFGDSVAGLQDLVYYGLKGAAAYVDHAIILGYEDDAIYAGIEEILNFLADNPTDIGTLASMALKVGEINLKAMELLDRANTQTYGHPEPSSVLVSAKKGKAILVSGHDLKDLEELLKQTEGKGINVYTHGEMLPALAYPELKKYKHFIGNYGGAWQDQNKEFDSFPGAILMTTNCLQKPRDTYKGRIFTSGLVAWPDVKHISDRDFAPVIKAALDAPGFSEDQPEKNITIGFARNTVLGVADKVIDAVKAGKIKHFFLVGGCDGAKPGRNYYTDFAQQVPQDCMILTLACGKYRFNKMDFGDIGGIPRLLDIGQCNDAYSAIQIAVALANAFGVGVNELPLSFILSWYEQKAVAILLTLLHLGIKNIRLGPSLPAFVTPDVLNFLVENFNIMPISTPEKDLKAILG